MRVISRRIRSKMVGTKARSAYKKKRKGFQNNRAAKTQAKRKNEEKSSGRQQPSFTASSTTRSVPSQGKRKNGDQKGSELPKESASRRKLSSVATNTEAKPKQNPESNTPVGYRLLDMNQLRESIYDAHKCKKGVLNFDAILNILIISFFMLVVHLNKILFLKDFDYDCSL